jgi:hypothetical protein
MNSHNNYIKRIVSKTIGHTDLAENIRPSITPDVLPIQISVRDSLFSNSLIPATSQIPPDDQELIRNTEEEELRLGRRKQREPGTMSRENSDRGDVSKPVDVVKSRENVRHSPIQQEIPEEFANNAQQVNEEMADKLLSTLPRNSDDTGKEDKDNSLASQPNLKLRGDGSASSVAPPHPTSSPTKSHEDFSQPFGQGPNDISSSQQLLPSDMMERPVSQKAGYYDDTRDSSGPIVKIQVRAVMPSSSSSSSYSNRLYAKTDLQQQQKQPPSPSLSLNDYLKKRAGERK